MVNRDKIKKRLESYTKKEEKKSNIWKPTKSKHTIRIVPYKFNLEDPFIFAYFYYGMNGKNICSPMSIGEADPIIQKAEQLKRTGNKEYWKLGNSLMPKKRIYLPIIDRDAEDQGVKFWGFGKQIQTQIGNYFANDDYGDISDVQTGTDLEITYQTPKEAGNDFGKITILAKRNSSPLSRQPKKIDLWLKEQQDFFDIYKIPTYQELENEFNTYLAGPKQKTSQTIEQVKEEINDSQDNEQSTEDDIVEKFRSKAKK